MNFICGFSNDPSISVQIYVAGHGKSFKKAESEGNESVSAKPNNVGTCSDLFLSFIDLFNEPA